MTALATLTRRFDFAIPEDQPPVEMTTGATIHTTEGLHMRVARRKDVPPPPQGRGPPMTEEEFEQRSGLQAKAGEAGGKCPFASALGPRRRTTSCHARSLLRRNISRACAACIVLLSTNSEAPVTIVPVARLQCARQ